jgi:tetratricopeptide (TPR) repeat protein
MSAIYRPTLDEVGKYGELRPNFMFWLAVAAVSRHVWFTAAVIAASARVKEASALLAGFSWWPVLIEAPALLVAVLAFLRRPDSGPLARAAWRAAPVLLTVAGLGQLAWIGWQWLETDRYSGWLTALDLGFAVAVMLALAWLWRSPYARALFADFPRPAEGDVAPAPPAPAGPAAVDGPPVEPEPPLQPPPSRTEASLVDMERVVAHFRNGEYADAESICRNLLVQEPNDPDATHFLGLMRHYQGDDEEGIRLLERSVALVPGFVNYQANLAAVYRAIGRTKDADRLDARVAELEGRGAGTAGPAQPQPAG